MKTRAISDDGMLSAETGIGGGYVRLHDDARARVLAVVERHLTPEFLRAYDQCGSAQWFDIELGALCNRIIKAPDRR